MLTKKCDIAIVGGGAIGTTLALALRSLPSLKTVLVDAGAPPKISDEINASSAEVRVFGLSYSSYLIFQALQLWPALAEAATPMTHVHISHQGRFGAVRLSAEEEGVPVLGYVIPASVLLSRLQQILKDEPKKVETCYATNVKGISMANPVIPRLDRGTHKALQDSPSHLPWNLKGIPHNPPSGLQKQSTVLDLETAGTRWQLSANYIIAADGSHSTVRRLLNVSAHEHDYQQTAVVTTVGISRPHQNSAYERFTKTGPLAMMPMQNNRCGVIWTIDNAQVDRIIKYSDDDFLKTLQKQWGYRLGNLQNVAPRRAYSLKSIRTCVSSQAPKNTVFIGNAANTLHPVAAQGLNLGLRDVAALKRCIETALAETENLSDTNLLENYLAGRKKDRARTFMFSDHLVQPFAKGPITAAAHRAGLLAVDFLPFLKSRLANVAMGRVG